ncbi:MAG: T9SS type A sorting domain-containing protein [Candidatus Marinimicrobia bacterium]|nr:T9SS type A sorting domain-containing protein [Candidatus Neomarinimicrobiota bacterium]
MKTLFFSLVIATFTIGQQVAPYAGNLSFDYSGTINGSFNADLSTDSSGAGGFVLSGSDTSIALITAFQPNIAGSTVDAFIMFMPDTTLPMEPQTWLMSLPIGEGIPNAFCMFLPDVDSTLLFDVLDLIDTTGGVGFSDSVLAEILLTLADYAYASVAGSIILDTVSLDTLGGAFSATVMQAAFPPPTIMISNGIFSLSGIDTSFVSVDPVDQHPESYTLLDAYPNPFNPSITIEYTIEHSNTVQIEIMNILGQRIDFLKEGYQSPGIYSIKWDASQHSGGVYFVRLKTKEQIKTQKIILLK